jgi:hypothetical protein
LSNAVTGAQPSIAFAFGNSGDRPLVGDWDGDGVVSRGVVRERPGFAPQWFLSDAVTGGGPLIAFAFGNPGDAPLVGDWNGDHADTAGVFRPEECPPLPEGGYPAECSDVDARHPADADVGPPATLVPNVSGGGLATIRLGPGGYAIGNVSDDTTMRIRSLGGAWWLGTIGGSWKWHCGWALARTQATGSRKGTGIGAGGCPKLFDLHSSRKAIGTIAHQINCFHCDHGQFVRILADKGPITECVNVFPCPAVTRGDAPACSSDRARPEGLHGLLALRHEGQALRDGQRPAPPLRPRALGLHLADDVRTQAARRAAVAGPPSVDELLRSSSRDHDPAARAAQQRQRRPAPG